MVGEITGTANVVIEGDLQGEVRIEGKVRVEPGGRVRGGLQGGELEVAGRVHGDVVGRERITLDASAELYGNLSAPRVVIHEGALFKGQVEMGAGTGGGRRSAAAEKPRPKGDDRRASPASPKTGSEAGTEGGTA